MSRNRKNTSSNFVYYVKIYCRSCRGGTGSTHLRRERFVPKGGPDGGDGGRGGHVILRGNDQLWTLLHLRYKKHVIAGNGGNGGRQRSTGADGEDIIIEVPVGTIARDGETGKFNFEICDNGEEKILLHGGKGGKGNVHFKSSTRQTPRFAQPGEQGIEAWKTLELKLLADVGLVGAPNAGKSTLLSVITAAKPKIADYEFTTLVPNLGIVEYRDYQSFVIADIPGIIEDAHLGKGLGNRFLRHIERNAILLFMVPADKDDILQQYQVLLNELRAHNPSLLDKPGILAVSKSDLLDERRKNDISTALEKIEHIFISSITMKGILQLKDKLWTKLNQ